jgi:hypothetical protein
MKDLRVISAKISPELFGELEDLRESLHIPTRQELIERALRWYLRSSMMSEELFTVKAEPDGKLRLLRDTGRTGPSECQNMSENPGNPHFSDLSDEELLTLYREADRPPAWMRRRVEEIEGGRA